MMVDVEYLKSPPHGGIRHQESGYARKQMIDAGHKIERLRAQIEGQDAGQPHPTSEPTTWRRRQSVKANSAEPVQGNQNVGRLVERLVERLVGATDFCALAAPCDERRGGIIDLRPSMREALLVNQALHDKEKELRKRAWWLGERVGQEGAANLREQTEGHAGAADRIFRILDGRMRIEKPRRPKAP